MIGNQKLVDAALMTFVGVSEMEKAVVMTIKDYVGSGGFLFAMCSATDSYDIVVSGKRRV